LSVPETAVQSPRSSAPEARFRNEIGQISRHSAVFFLGTLFTTAAGYFFKIYVARMLGADALGIYALGMTVVGFFGLFNGLGLPQAAVRFVAAYSATQQYERLHAFLRRAIGLLAAANIGLAGVMILLGPWIARNVYRSPQLDSYLHLFAVILVVSVVGTFLGQVLVGYKNVARRTVITNFIGSPLNIVLGVVLIAGGMGLRGYVWAQIGSGVTVLLLLTVSAWRLTPKTARNAPVTAVPLETEVFWFSAAVFGMNGLEFLLGQADKIVMGMFLDVGQVGIYTIAVSMVAFVPIALQSVNQIFSPTIADLHARGEQALLGRIFQTLTKWVLGVTLPLAFVMIVFSKPLMRLFGPAFEAGWIVLILGVIGQLVNVGVGSVGYLLLMSGNQNRLIRVQAIMAVFMVAVTMGMVKPFGMIGVALAGSVTNVVTNYLCLREVRIALRLSPYNRSYVRLLVPCVVSISVIVGLRRFLVAVHPEWLPVVIALVLSYATFSGLVLLLGLDEDDRMIVGAIQQRLLGAAGRMRSLSI
jgi:O-antigen/teichoic acid export membrane protein